MKCRVCGGEAHPCYGDFCEDCWAWRERFCPGFGSIAAMVLAGSSRKERVIRKELEEEPQWHRLIDA